MTRFACVFFVFLIAAPALHPQVRESVTVEVVEVPVYVTTPAGEPLRGLARDNFQLFVNGRPQAIDYFDPIDFAAPPAPGVRDQRERRLYLLLFDFLNQAPEPRDTLEHLARAQRAAYQAIANANPATDYFAVATFTASRGMQFASPFLNDRVAVRRAIETLSMSTIHDPLGLGLSAAERSVWVDRSLAGNGINEQDPFGAEQEKSGGTPSLMTEPSGGTGAGGGRFADVATAEMASALAGGQVAWENRRMPANNLIENQLGNLEDLAGRLARMEGQKHVVLLTEGFDSTLLTDITRTIGPPQFNDRLLRARRDMVAAFTRAGVFLDTIDIHGVRHTGNDLENDSLHMLSRETGGDVVKNRNDLAEAFATLTAHHQVVYLLGFQRRDQRGGDIDVKVTGVPRGAHVTFRPGFGKPEHGGDVDPLQLADVLINDVPQTGLRIASKIEPRAGGAELEFALFPQEIAPQLVDKTPYVDAFLYVFDASGATVMVKSKRIDLGGGKNAGGPIILREQLSALPGRYVTKVLAHIEGTQSLGFARRDIEVTP